MYDPCTWIGKRDRAVLGTIGCGTTYRSMWPSFLSVRPDYHITLSGQGTGGERHASFVAHDSLGNGAARGARPPGVRRRRGHRGAPPAAAGNGVGAHGDGAGLGRPGRVGGRPPSRRRRHRHWSRGLRRHGLRGRHRHRWRRWCRRRQRADVGGGGGGWPRGVGFPRHWRGVGERTDRNVDGCRVVERGEPWTWPKRRNKWCV